MYPHATAEECIRANCGTCAQNSHDMVCVDWTDSIVDGGWVDREEAQRRAGGGDAMRAHSVGFLLTEDDDYFLLATSYMRDGDLVQGTLQIPRSAIHEVWRLTALRSE